MWCHGKCKWNTLYKWKAEWRQELTEWINAIEWDTFVENMHVRSVLVLFLENLHEVKRQTKRVLCGLNLLCCYWITILMRNHTVVSAPLLRKRLDMLQRHRRGWGGWSREGRHLYSIQGLKSGNGRVFFFFLWSKLLLRFLKDNKVWCFRRFFVWPRGVEIYRQISK